MATYLAFKSNHDSTSQVVSGTAGYTILADGTSLGSVVQEPMFPKVANNVYTPITGMNTKAREQQISILVSHTTVAGLQALIDNLQSICEKINRTGGGVMIYRSETGTYCNYYRVNAAMLVPASGQLEYENFYRMRVVISVMADPFTLADTYDITDAFSTDTLGTGGLYNLGGADWTKASGASSASVSSGVLTTTSVDGETIYLHTGTPHEYADVQVTAKVRFNTNTTSRHAILVAKYVDANNYLRLYSNCNVAGTMYLYAQHCVAGITTNANLVTMAVVADTWYWLRARVEGNVLFVEFFTSEPTPMATPTYSTSLNLASTAGAVAALGEGIAGQVGLGFDTNAAGTISFDDFRVRPMTYRNVTFPAVLRLRGAWGGTADAMAGIYYTGSGGTAPTSMLYAWWPKIETHNYIDRGGAEIFSSAAVANGWVATAVAGVIGAATSVARVTTSTSVRTGTGGYEVVTPATTDTGASYIIYRRGGFRKGVTYTAQCYVRAAVGTTAVRVKLGVSGDIGTGTASALTTTFTARTVTWTPTADYDVAYFAVGVNAATATTFQFDDVMVFEGTTAPTFEPGGFGPGIIPSSAGNTIDGDGGAWANTTDADYLVGSGMQASGALTTTGNLKFPILPHLFTPDDYASDEVDVAVFARIEVASTQTSLACAISMAPERGTSYGARRYGSFRSGGKTIKLPSSGTVFKPYFLGIVTLRVDKSRPRREWLKVSFTNSGSATGTVGLDYLVVVPVRSCARSISGTSASIAPSFIASTAETTKAIGVSSALRVVPSLVGGIVDHTNGDSLTPDDGLLGEPVSLPASTQGAELLVWPSDQVVDLTDSSSSTMAETFAGTVQVSVQPQHHIMRQS